MNSEFVPAAENPAQFIVAEQIMEAFIKHLNLNKVCVHNIKPCFTDSDGEYFSLEVQDGIPPQDGDQLVATFKLQHQQSEAEIRAATIKTKRIRGQIQTYLKKTN